MERNEVDNREIVISASHITKKYLLYNSKKDRLLETIRLTRKVRHQEFLALNDVSFDVRKGEFIGVIGKNGSGKSTLLKILSGVLSPSNGDISIRGRVSSLLELGAGFNPEYTGEENIYLNGTIMGYSREEMAQKIPDIIRFADIGSFIEQPVKMYSSGMYVRLAFAVAINVEPDILIVDEALAVGDLNFQLKCMAKFDEFCERGVTIIFVSHDINSVKKFCSRTIWLKNGQIEKQGVTSEVADAYTDFLKTELSQSREIEKTPQQTEVSEKINKPDTESLEAATEQQSKQSEVKNASAICDVLDVVLLDENLEEIDHVEFGQHIYARLDFNMNSRELDEISVGIAIHSIDNKYICGLNTMIDKFQVPYRIGKNSVYLEYKSFNLLGGTYYFDTAVFERNAYVPLEYRGQIKKFTVYADYVGEGIFILDHEWRLSDEVQ